jgi:hypothetical protein
MSVGRLLTAVALWNSPRDWGINSTQSSPSRIANGRRR